MASIKSKVGLTALLAATLSSGCIGYTQVKGSLGWGNDVPLYGVEILQEKDENRFGINVHYGRPDSRTAIREYEIDVGPIQQDLPDLEKTTDFYLIKTSGFVERCLAEYETDDKIIALRYCMGAGGMLDVVVSTTDYRYWEANINNIPGVKVDGRFFMHASPGIRYGPFPLEARIMATHEGEVLFFLMTGYEF